MSTYLHKNQGASKYTERHIYASSRLGLYKEPVSMLAVGGTGEFVFDIPGYRQYELTNHLGNVTTILTGQKVPIVSGSTLIGYNPQIVQSLDYSPFGVTRLSFDVTAMSTTHPVGGGYRYGFNGMEKDDEVKGSGNSLDFGLRVHDPRLGRLLSLDPLSSSFASESNYSFSGNNPIYLIDVDGGYKYPAGKKASYTKDYPVFTKYLSSQVENDVTRSTLLKNALSYATNETKTPGSQGTLYGDVLQKTVKWNDGPTIEITSAPGGVSSANGYFVESTSTIQINKDLVDFVENVAPEDRQAALFAVMNTVYHETAHYGEGLDGPTRRYDTEAGDTFEQQAHSQYNWNARWSGELIMRNADGTVNYQETLGEAKVAMEEMSKTKEGNDALPSKDD